MEKSDYYAYILAAIVGFRPAKTENGIWNLGRFIEGEKDGFLINFYDLPVNMEKICDIYDRSTGYTGKQGDIVSRVEHFTTRVFPNPNAIVYRNSIELGGYKAAQVELKYLINGNCARIAELFTPKERAGFETACRDVAVINSADGEWV